MDIHFDEEEKFSANLAPAKLTPGWLKRTLLVFLFVLSITGFGAGIFLLKKAVSMIPKQSGSSLNPKPSGSSLSPDTKERKGFSLLAGKNDASSWVFSKDAITCQGTIIHESGKALALINGKVVPVDGTINGFRVLEVTANDILIERDGETHRILAGKSFTPEKK